MRPPADDDAEVRRLLKLKRYEQPPPEYFKDLSQGVLHRLRGPEGLRQQSLLGVLGLRFGLKPALFYGLGAVCSVLAAYGVVSLLAKTPPTVPERPPAPGLLGGEAAAPGRLLGSEAPADVGLASTNPVLSPGSQTLLVDPARVRPTSAPYRPR